MVNVILQGVVGSTAYGLAREGSDVDRLGVYIAPIDEVLGLAHDKVIDTTKVDKAPKPDKTLHEVGKYLSLALQCNPTILELMWLTGYEIKDDFAGQAILDLRDKVLSTNAVKGRYGGYATEQARRLMQRHESREEGFSSDVRTRTEKHGRHCARLLLQGSQLLSTGRIQVDVSEHRDYLFGVGRLALEDPEGFYNQFLKLRANMDQIESVLPDYPDRDAVQNGLVGIRLGMAEL